MVGESRPGSLDGVDDRLLAVRSADGDTAAFAALVRRYTPMMRAYARRLLTGSAEVDDVVQESFVTAWDQLDTVNDPGAVRSWLMRIVSRKAADRTRSGRRHEDIDEVDVAAPAQLSPPRMAEARAGMAALDVALRALPEDQRRCWILREAGGYAYDEIAAELYIPVSTVRGLLARARKGIIVRMEGWR